MIAELLSSVLSGGATGLFGAAISRWADYKTKKLDLSHELAMREADAAILREEWAQRTKIADIEASAVADKADAEAFAKSFNEPQRYSEGVTYTSKQGWVLIALDAFRGVIRPGLTVYLCLITTYLYWDAHRAMGTLGVIDQTKLVGQIVSTVLYLFTTCTLWYFGVRNSRPSK